MTTFDTEKIKKLSLKPGVYIMKNRRGTVLYVGKAKSLKQRVRQYFTPTGDGRFMVPFLIANVADIDTIVVSSEKEALLLENTLIKKFKPKYNALLKDDKSYIALKVTKHKWARIDVVRYRGRPEKGGQYFGPYAHAGAARRTLDLLHKMFPLRQCSDQEFARRTRPCLLYDMKKCPAPCVKKCSLEEYEGYVSKAIRFLKGQDKEVVQELTKEMHKASDSLNFERAGEIHKTLQMIETTIESQLVDKPMGVDVDALAIYRQGEEVILSQLRFRYGRLTGSTYYNFDHIAQDNSSLYQTFIIQHYEFKDKMPHEIIVPEKIEGAAALSDIIKAHVFTPQRGDKVKLVQMALENAEATFKKDKDASVIREKMLIAMQEKFRLTRYPRRIECFDNSNISGTTPVSAMVTFLDGIKEKKGYRKYKIKTVQTPDDYATMYEVLMRRYKRGKEENNLPDLLIVDGGKGHLNVALRVFEELNIINVDLISVAKESSRHDKGMTSEQVYLPNIKDPVNLPRTSPILFLLQQIRDEAHRFAITFHRSARSKKIISSILDEVPGIGPAKKRALLRHFGSIKQLMKATIDEIASVKGIGQKDAEAIVRAFLKK